MFSSRNVIFCFFNSLPLGTIGNKLKKQIFSQTGLIVIFSENSKMMPGSEKHILKCDSRG